MNKNTLARLAPLGGVITPPGRDCPEARVSREDYLEIYHRMCDRLLVARDAPMYTGLFFEGVRYYV